MARAHCAVVAFDPGTNTVLTSATVNVYSPGTTSAIGATIFDKNGSTLSNPLTSDSTTGLVDFYLAVAQEVDLVVSKNGFTTRTYSNVPVLDDASNNLTALLTTTGDIAYASSANTPARLPIGAAGGVLVVNGGVPVWSNSVNTGIVVKIQSGSGGGDAPFEVLQSGGTRYFLCEGDGRVIINDGNIGGGGLTVSNGTVVFPVGSGGTKEMLSMMFGSIGYQTLNATNAVNYISLSGVYARQDSGGSFFAGQSTTESLVQMPMAFAATIKNLRVLTSGAGTSTSVTLRVNGVDSALTVSFSTATTTSDTTHSVSVSASDLVNWKISTPGTTVTSPTIVAIVCEVDG